MKWLAQTGRALCTARHLRLMQALALLRHKMSPAAGPGPSAAWGSWDPGAATVVAALGALGPVDTPGAIARHVAAFAQGSVEMLGRTLPWRDAWQDRAGNTPLWRYHLHYHDLLADAAWVAREHNDPALALRIAEALGWWMDDWGAGGRPAWDPYPVSVRLVNWLRILAWAGPRIPASMHARMQALHAGHLDLLSRRFEWHLQGNHLLRNAWALLIGAYCWSGSRARMQRARSGEVYFAQLIAQVGEDGLHEERSPMYHVRALRDALEAVGVLDGLGERVPAAVRQRIRLMAEVVPWLRRSDGTLFLLNDSAHDHGVDLDRVLHLATELVEASPAHPRGVRAFSDGRLVIAVDPRGGDRLLVDLGAPAPAHQPAHAHAGALGIDLDLGGLPLLVDPGCSGYDGDPFRPYFRGTRAHNTITIDGKDQSELWGAFRVARRADVVVEAIRGDVDALSIRAVCRPYHDRPAHHHRSIQRRGRDLLVEDRVVAAPGKRAELHWHLHPDWSATASGAGVHLEHLSGTRVSLTLEGPVELTLHRGEKQPILGWYAGGFGHVVPTWTVRGTFTITEPCVVRTLIHPES